MLPFWVVLFLGLIMFHEIRKLRTRTIVRRHQFLLYTLRDELREAVMNDEIDPRNWVFVYLDSSITKTISVLREVSFWSVLAASLMRRRDQRFNRAREHLTRELDKPSNRVLREMHQEYVRILLMFTFERHLALRLLLVYTVRIIATAQFLQEKWRQAVEIKVEAPETSTLQKVVPAYAGLGSGGTGESRGR